MLHSAGYGDPKLPHLSVDLLQQRPPLSHSPAVMSLLHVVPTQTGRHFPPNAVRLDCKKSYQNSTGNASGSSTILRQKTVMPLPISSRPMLVWMMDCWWENR